MILANLSQEQQVIFAMHDPTLDVNTWIASDNSTQLHTIDLNNGSISSTSTMEGGETEEGADSGDQESDFEEDDEDEPSSDEDTEEDE
jgi:hypothetical protein